jgi:hypothetical protein
MIRDPTSRTSPTPDIMGEGKWLDMDTAVDMFPDKADQIRGGDGRQ